MELPEVKNIQTASAHELLIHRDRAWDAYNAVRRPAHMVRSCSADEMKEREALAEYQRIHYWYVRAMDRESAGFVAPAIEAQLREKNVGEV